MATEDDQYDDQMMTMTDDDENHEKPYPPRMGALWGEPRFCARPRSFGRSAPRLRTMARSFVGRSLGRSVGRRFQNRSKKQKSNTLLDGKNSNIWLIRGGGYFTPPKHQMQHKFEKLTQYSTIQYSAIQNLTNAIQYCNTIASCDLARRLYCSTVLP